MTSADLEAIQMSLAAGQLLRQVAEALHVEPAMNVERKRSLLEELLAAQRAELEAARRANSQLVRVDDVIVRLLNTIQMLADHLDFIDRQRSDALRLEATKLGNALSIDARVDVLRGTAQSANARGEFVRALDLMAEAISLVKKGADIWRVARTSMDRADILQQLGDFDAALEEVETVREWLASGRLDIDTTNMFRMAEQTIARRRLQFDIEFQTGIVERGRGNYEVAKAAIAAAIEHAARLNQPVDLVRYQLATIALRENDPSSAEGYLNAAEPLLQAAAPHRMHSITLCRGWAALLRGDYTTAIELLTAARDGAEAIGDQDSRAKAAWRLGLAAEHVDERLASRAYREACVAADRARRAPLGYRLDSCFLRDKYPAFIDAIRWFTDQEDAASCLEAMELIKSRRLAATLSTTESSDERRSARVAELYRVSRQLDAITMGSSTTVSREAVVALEAQRLELIDELRRSDPRFRSLTLAPFDVEQLQTSLAELHATALGLFLHDATVTAVLVTPSSTRVERKVLDDKTRDALDDYLQNLSVKNFDPYKFDISDRYGVRFDDLVPAGLVPECLSRTRLIISPHRELHALTWATLVHDGEPICARIAVGIVPCLSAVSALSKKLETPAISLFGPPHYSRRSQDEQDRNLGDYLLELDELEEGWFGTKQRPRLESATVDALYTALRSEKGAAGVVIACHGNFNVAEPLRSALELFDGNVDAASLMHSSVAVDEVYLRSCYAGQRATRVGDLDLLGDDILGLSGALLEAGVRAILVCIPPLVRTPQARQFFWRFLDKRRSGLSPLLSLAEAQRAALASGDDPSSWAGFTAYGVY